MTTDRERWDRRYREGFGQPQIPDPFLSWAHNSFVSRAFPQGGTAIDLAGGPGRHSLWLAERQWQVTMVDTSEVAIARARSSAGVLAAHIDFCAQSVEQCLARRKQYDLVIVFYFLDRSLFSAIENTIRAGGFLIYKTYTTEQRRFGSGPTDSQHLLVPGELARAFPGLHTVHCAEIVEQKATAELVARRPR